MDSLDIRIIKTVVESGTTSPLDLSPKKSYSTIAKKLRVGENTVKNRMGKLYKSGFLMGWCLAINPDLIGQQMAQVWIELKDISAKEKAIEKVLCFPE